MREIEELSTKETAASLDLTEEVVRIRLHRARALLKSKIYNASTQHKKSVYHLDLRYCDRIVSGVLAMIKGATN
jgi:RNA polymerase sigma-70 factor (ECF subfamily)